MSLDSAYTIGGEAYTIGGEPYTIGASMTLPSLTTPYDVIVIPKGASGSLNLNNGNWSGASSFSITGLPSWAAQSGSTAIVNYTDAKWGGKGSNNTIGEGLWFIEVQAIGSDPELTTSTFIYLYINK